MCKKNGHFTHTCMHGTILHIRQICKRFISAMNITSRKRDCVDWDICNSFQIEEEKLFSIDDPKLRRRRIDHYMYTTCFLYIFLNIRFENQVLILILPKLTDRITCSTTLDTGTSSL